MATAVLPFIVFLLAVSAVPRSIRAQRAVSIPVRTPGQTVHLEGFVYQPPGDGRHPIVVFSHGSSGGDLRNSDPEQELAGYYTRRGYAVIVAMRCGRGRSEGASLESEEKNCDPSSWGPGLATAFDDLTAVIDFARALPFVDSSRVVLVGVSRGGFLSVAYAARGARRSRVEAVVNFVGAWVAQAEDRCPQDFNLASFRQYGRGTHVPTLWLYGQNDSFNSDASIQSYVSAFRSGGGHAQFYLIAGVTGNGHRLPQFPDLWQTQSDAFLASLNDHQR